MTDADPSQSLAEAVRQTLQRACEVTVRVRTASTQTMDEFAPGLTGDGMPGTGAADFLGDRARLMLDTDELRFDGPRTYWLLGDGRWRLTEGDRGTWGMLHPRFPLEAILQAGERVAVLDGGMRVELNRAGVSALSDAGVSPDWRPAAAVVLSDGLVRVVRLELIDRTSSQASMVTTFEYEPVDQLPVINLPALTDTITASDWIREQETESSVI